MNNLDHNTGIGVIAGGGNAPKVIIDSLRSQKIKYFVIAINGNADPSNLQGSDHEFVEIGEFKKVLNILKKHSISHVSFIGSIKRPSLSSIKLDSESALFMTKFGLGKFTGGDNNLLTSILSFFEKKGYKILGPENLSPELITPKGVLGKIKPSGKDKLDIEIGVHSLNTLGQLDIGQSIIVENSYVLGVEAAEGTNNLIKRCKDLKREKKQSGVLVKLKKHKQDPRIDLPSIGINTVKEIKRSGLNGIAIGSNNSFIIDIKNVIKEADKNNIFLVGI